MSDGSNMGITAGRALSAVLGSDDQPTEDEMQSKEEVFKRVRDAPNPLEGETVFSRFGEDGYSVATDVIAKAFLLIEEEFPGTLEAKAYFSPENTEIEDLWGKECSAESAVWRKVMNKWPEFDKWLGGASGFMVGFAYNTARWLNDKPIVENPAIVTIDLDKIPNDE
jgi:hypothetical protein